MTEPPAGAGIHPDMMNAGISNTVNANGVNGATGVNGANGKHHHLDMHHPDGAQSYYDDSYDNVPGNAGTDTCTNEACNMKNMDGMGNTINVGHHQDKHNHNHRHGPMAGLGAAAGGVAGAAAGKHMHNHNNDGHAHHNRGGTIPGGPGMTGAGMTGGMTGGEMTGGGMGMDSATMQMEADQVTAEENNNFPGTNPHPAHSALSTRGQGHGLAFPGQV